MALSALGLPAPTRAAPWPFRSLPIAAGPHAVGEIAAIVQKEDAQKIILGESHNFKGEANKVMEDIEQFKKDLEEVTGLAVVYEAEFLSSAAAARQYRRANPSPERVGAQPERREKLDASAAAVILQSYLDSQKNKK